VDQVANAATGLGPLWVESQLKALVQRYPGTGIEKRAQELLDRQADAVADDLAPNRNIPQASDPPVLHSPGTAGISAPGSAAADPGLSTAIPPPSGGLAMGPQYVGGTLQEQSPSRSPRGPPRTHARYVVTGAAGLLFLVLTARRLWRSSLQKGIRI
jgi:hypothetical protein